MIDQPLKSIRLRRKNLRKKGVQLVRKMKRVMREKGLRRERKEVEIKDGWKHDRNCHLRNCRAVVKKLSRKC